MVNVTNVQVKRSRHTSNISVKVDGEEYSLYHGLIEHCAKKLSNSELRAVSEAVTEQLNLIDDDDIPLIFKEMQNELAEAIINRKAFQVKMVLNDPPTP